MSYSRHAKLAKVIFNREEVAEILKDAAEAKLKLSNISVGHTIVRWQDDGAVEVITPYTPLKP